METRSKLKTEEQNTAEPAPETSSNSNEDSISSCKSNGKSQVPAAGMQTVAQAVPVAVQEKEEVW